MQLERPNLHDTWGIHALIVDLYRSGTIRIGFLNGPQLPEAIELLRRAEVRKPLFANVGNWIRDSIVADRIAFHALGSLTELQFLVDGSPRTYYGFGLRRPDPLPEGHFLQDHFPEKQPIIVIPLLDHFDRFAPYLSEGVFGDETRA